MTLHEIFESADAGVTSAHSIAGVRGSLLKGGTLDPTMVRRNIPPQYKVKRMKKRVPILKLVHDDV